MPNLEDIELIDLMVQELQDLGYEAHILFRENSGFRDIEVGSRGCRAFVGVTRDLKIFIRCRQNVCFHGSAFDPNTIDNLLNVLSQHCLRNKTCDNCRYWNGKNLWEVVKV